MTALNTERGFVRRKEEKASPLSLLIALIREKGGTLDNESQHKAAFRVRINDPDYLDFHDALVDEWLSMKYTTAFLAAHPPTAEELKRQRERRKREKEQEASAVEVMKMKIAARSLALVMPNGKKLAKCTGAECIAFGGWFAKIGERVGPKRLVGDVLSNKELMAI